MITQTSDFKILLVEDETALGEVCVEILQLNGYSVDYFSNGLEALESVKKNDQVQLLITDINMDHITGPRLFSELSKKMNTTHMSKLPVIFMSGEYEQKMQLADSDNCGIYYLAKPFQVRDLIQQVSVVYQKHSALNNKKAS